MTETAEREAVPQTFPIPRRPGTFARLGSKARTALTSDLPLKLLALVLAVMAWLVVREKIVTTETVQDVPVEIVVPESVVVVSPQERPRVNLRLQGTWSEVAHARRAISEGRPLVLRLLDIERQVEKGQKEGGTRPIAEPNAFTFPFPNPEIVTVLTPVTVFWNAIEEKTVTVAPPRVDGTAAARVDASATLDTTSVRLRGPATLFPRESLAPLTLTPDPVDAAPWLKTKPELSTPWATESGFDRWREGDPRLRSPRVLQIKPEVVRMKVKFRATGGRVLESRLRRLVDPAWEKTHEFDIERSPEYDPATELLRVSVFGEPAVLDRLEKNAAEWHFYVVLPEPSAEEAANGEHKEAPVALHLPPGVHATLEKAPTLFVTIKKR